MEKRVLYFDCFSGISGDMTIGALIDLGVDSSYLMEQLKSLNIDGYKIEITKRLKKGISGTDFNVILEENHSHHNHEHCETVHEHGHCESPAHNHSYEHEYEHDHEHYAHAEAHKKDEHEHHHSRNIKDIFEIINSSPLNDNIKNMSREIFKVIAEAEAKIHGKAIDEVHFHEVGAVDSIIDIIGTAICIDKLAVDEIIASPVNVGSGTVKCQHGIMPVPAPATAEILRGIPVYSGEIKKEMTTPTGAAILKVLAKEFISMPEVEIENIGYGIGKRDLEEQANVLRVILCKKKTPAN